MGWCWFFRVLEVLKHAYAIWDIGCICPFLSFGQRKSIQS